MLTTTLNDIRKHGPCEGGWKNLLSHLGKTRADNEPLDMRTVLESNGVPDFMWCLRVLPSEHDNAVRLLACDIAERALRFVPAGEERPRAAIETARRFAHGDATEDELSAARDAARDAVAAVPSPVRDAVFASVWATTDNARDTARDVAWAAAWAAVAAAIDGAWDAEISTQRQIINGWIKQFEG